MRHALIFHFGVQENAFTITQNALIYFSLCAPAGDKAPDPRVATQHDFLNSPLTYPHENDVKTKAHEPIPLQCK